MTKEQLQKQISKNIQNQIPFLIDNPHELSNITNKIHLAVGTVKSGGYSRKKKREDFIFYCEHIDRKGIQKKQSK